MAVNIQIFLKYGYLTLYTVLSGDRVLYPAFAGRRSYLSCRNSLCRSLCNLCHFDRVTDSDCRGIPSVVIIFQNSYKYVSRSTGIAFRPESGYCPVPWT